MSPPDGGRDGAAADEFVRESFRDIKRTLEIIQQQLSFMPQHYVSRAEFDRHRDELVVDLAGAQKQQEKDIASVRTEIRDVRIDLKAQETKAEERQEKAEEHARQARNTRVAVLGIALATLVALPAALWAVYMLTHH